MLYLHSSWHQDKVRFVYTLREINAWSNKVLEHPASVHARG